MTHLELAWIVGFAAAASAGCVATIDASASAGAKRGNVGIELAEDDAGAVPAEAPDAPETAPRQPDAATPAPPKPPIDAGSMPPMAAMATAGSASPPPADAGVACDFRGLVQAKCGNASCHGAPASSTGLDLTSPSLATRLAGRKGPSACSNNLLIDSANPARSALYLKVTSMTCGSQMPLGGSLTPGEQACVLSWIEAL
jgi:hypothetical protein